MSHNASTPSKDRKVMRRIDYAAARTSVSGVLAALLVYAVLGSVGSLYSQYQSLTMGFGLAIIVAAIYRLVLFFRFDALYGAAPGRWRWMFGFGLVLHALIWGQLLAVMVWLYGTGFNFLLVAVYVIGVATALGSSWMAGLAVRLSYPLLMLLPGIIVLLAERSIEAAVLAALLGTYMFYLLQLYRQLYDAFWRAMHREQRVPAEKTPVTRIAPGQIQLSLVYRLAHEIRTPMNSIMGMLSLLRETPLNDEQREYHFHANQSGNLLLTLIDDVLDYSRVLNGRIVLSPDWFDLRAALAESLDAYGVAAHHAGLELSCVVDQHVPRRLRGDRERLMQVINNLISNAIKFSDKGEVSVDITLQPISDEEGVLQVSVRDQGQGMDAETRRTLFHDVMLDSDANDLFSARHTGFGLLVCKGLVNAMGGSIDVESTPGEGSRFWFGVRLGMQSDMQGRDPLTRRLGRHPVLAVGCSDGNGRALVEEFQALATQCLLMQDYDHALQALREGYREHTDFTLLLIDSHERRESALNLARTVLDDPALERVRVILVTTVDERARPSTQKLLQQPRVGLLLRPVQRHPLREVLARLFEIESVTAETDSPARLSEQDKDREKWRLLLVEDNEINQIVTRGMLDKLGYQVKTVSDGRAALALLEREKFDLILMDCMMPEFDGFDTTRAIRQREQEAGSKQRVPVIAMTAHTLEGAEARCLAAGMDDYMAKPVHLDELDAMLAHWLHSDNGTAVIDDEEITP